MIDLTDYNESLTGASGIFRDGRQCDRCGNKVVTLYQMEHKSGDTKKGVLVCSCCLEDRGVRV